MINNFKEQLAELHNEFKLSNLAELDRLVKKHEEVIKNECLKAVKNSRTQIYYCALSSVIIDKEVKSRVNLIERFCELYGLTYNNANQIVTLIEG